MRHDESAHGPRSAPAEVNPPESEAKAFREVQRPESTQCENVEVKSRHGVQKRPDPKLLLRACMADDHASDSEEGTPHPGVSLLIGHGPCFVVDPLPSLLNELQYSVREFEQGVRRGHRSHVQQVFPFAPDHRGRMIGCIGLLPRVLDHLAAHRIPIKQMVDFRVLRPELAPDLAAVAAMRAPDRQIAEAAINVESLCGQIEMGSSRVVHQIVQLVACFPKARVLIIAATMRTCRALAKRLQAALGVAVEVAGRGHIPESVNEKMWVTVSTYAYARVFRPHVVVVADAEQGLAHGAREHMAVGRWDPTRIYALRRPSLRLSWADEIRLEMSFGPVIYRSGLTRASVTVQLCVSRQFAPPAPPQGVLERKRTAIWH